jgi:hypothetical protein
VFVGLQCILQEIEGMSVDSVLESIKTIWQQNLSGSVRNVEASIDKLLNTNDRENLRGNFKVYQSGNTIKVMFSREWKLNLICAEQAMKYERTLTLK